jgi:carbon monoxide dehydrogenase subunit G
VRIREDFTVGRPAAEVWESLRDPAVLVDCVPGVSGGVVAVDLAAEVVELAGEARFSGPPGEQVGRVEIRAADRGGAGRVRAAVEIRVDDHGLFSAVHLEADLTLSGRLAELGRAGLVAEAIHGMVLQFADCLEQRLGGPPAVRSEAPREAGTLPRPDRSEGGRLLRLLRSLLRRE